MLVSRLLSATMIAGANEPRAQGRSGGAGSGRRQTKADAARRESARRGPRARGTAGGASHERGLGGGAAIHLPHMPDYANSERFRI
jgi:hypothetical protein